MGEEEKRELILRAARQVMARFGFQATKMEDIARQAGVAKGSVYNYFPSKDAVAIAVAEDFFRQWDPEPLLAGQKDYATRAGTLLTVLDQALALSPENRPDAEDDPDHEKLVFHIWSAALQEAHTPVLEIFKEYFAKFEKFLTEFFQEAPDLAGLDPAGRSLAARGRARLFIGLLDGLGLQVMVAPMEAPLRENMIDWFRLHLLGLTEAPEKTSGANKGKTI